MEVSFGLIGLKPVFTEGRDRLNRPLVWLGLCFGFGIALQYTVKAEIKVLFIAGIVLIAALVFCFIQRRSAVGIILAMALVSGSVWFAVTDLLQLSHLLHLENKRVDLHGMLLGTLEIVGDKVICDILADKYKSGRQPWQQIRPERVRVYFFSSEEDGLTGQKKLEQAEYGSLITAHGKIVLPRLRRNPGEFDYRQYLRIRKIHTLLYVYPDSEVVVETKSPSSPANRIISFAMRFRDNFSALARANLTEREAVILLAMLFGEQRAVYEEDMEMFRETGLAHALSVSGFHTALVLMLVLIVCKSANLKPRTTLVLSAFALFSYCILSAFTVTVVRSSLMGILGLLAYSFDRERNVYTALAFAGLVILIWNPYFLLDPGFQLSFSAVWAMAYLEPFLRDLLPDCLYPHASVATIPLSAQLGTLPIVAWHFNMVSPLAVFANILLVPVMSAIVIIGLIALVFSWIPLLPAFFLHGCGFLIDIVVVAGSAIGRLPGTVFFVARPSLWALLVYYVLVVFSAELLSGRINPLWLRGRMSDGSKRIVSIIALLCSLVPILFTGVGTGQLRIFFLDVGQGDAILIQGPSGNTALVDGGGMPGFYGQGYDPGKDTVLPFLRRRGINSVDLIINSHPDEDHLDGLEDVLEEMAVGRIMTPPVEGWEEEYKTFLTAADRIGVPHTVLAKGAQIKFDRQVVIRVLAPDSADKSLGSNNASLVLQVCHGSNRFLLLGDIETEGIDKLLANCSDLESSVIKIPHHGARGSYNENLYRESNAAVAVISVGQNNTFGHPSQEVVDYWLDRGADLYRTDLNGCVTVTSDGKDVFVETMYGGK